MTFAINQRLEIRNNNRMFEILLRDFKTFHCECNRLKIIVRTVNIFLEENSYVKIPKRICMDHKEKWSRGKLFEE